MSSSRPELRLAWASHDAMRYACTHWHYSRCVPSGKLVRVGAWEGGKFIGVVIFGRGANRALSGKFGLTQTECCELVRIALTNHAAPVSRIASIAVRMLRQQSPGLKLIVSYADPEKGHHGGIYQGMGWLYIGHSNAQSDIVVNGVRLHKRTVSARYGTASIDRLKAAGVRSATRSEILWKHSYVLPLDDDITARLREVALPYPKRAKQAMAGPPEQRRCVTDPRAPTTARPESAGQGEEQVPA